MVNGNGNTKILWIADLFLEIWPASEMCQLLLNSCCKYGFEKTICKQAKTSFFLSNGVENCKKTLKSSSYLTFSAKFGQRVKWVNPYSTHAANTVLKKLYANKLVLCASRRIKSSHRLFPPASAQERQYTPNLEDQGITLSLASTLRPVRHGWPYLERKTPADIALGVTETHKCPTTWRWWSHSEQLK